MSNYDFMAMFHNIHFFPVLYDCWKLGLPQGYPYHALESYPGQHLGYPLPHTSHHPYHHHHQTQSYPGLPSSSLSPQNYPPHSSMMVHPYHHHHHLYSPQQPPAPSQSPGLGYTLPVHPQQQQHGEVQHQPPQQQQQQQPSVISQSQSGYPPLSYQQPSAGGSSQQQQGISMPISTYIPPVQAYEPPLERSEHPPQIQRPTPILAEREVNANPGVHMVPQTPNSAVPMSFHLQQSQQTSPAPPSPGPSGMMTPGGGTHPDLEHDLPPELLQQGWRKMWSKRENRIYFWNKTNGESLWEMPPLRPNVIINKTKNCRVSYLTLSIILSNLFEMPNFSTIRFPTRSASSNPTSSRQEPSSDVLLTME